MTYIPPPAGAITTARLLTSAASTNATSVKASAGKLLAISGRNNRTTPVYFKVYNKASAPTVGTDTPVLTEEIPSGSRFSMTFDLYLGTGIAYALTTAAADADTGAVASGDITTLNILYS